MSDITSSEGASETSNEPARRPQPQPFSQAVPERRPTGQPPRTASIYDESEPVVRSESKPRPAPAAPSPTPAVTGNAPERRPADNPFPKAAPAQASAASQPPQQAPQRAFTKPSSTLKAAEQLRAAAGEKARQLRQTAETRSRQTQQELPDLQPEAAPEAVVTPPPAPAPTYQQPAPQPQAVAPPAASLSPSAQLKVDEWKSVAEATWADASIVLKDIQVEGERYIRANPTRAAMTALGVGFVLGVFLKR